MEFLLAETDQQVLFWLLKVVLLLLGSCQEELLTSDGLEGAVEVMKTSLPPFAEQNVEWLVSQVLSLDITKDLESYEVSDILLKSLSCESGGSLGGSSVREGAY